MRPYVVDVGARLLPDIGSTRSGSSTCADIARGFDGSLRAARTAAEEAAERCLFIEPGRRRQCVRYCALVLLVECDDCVAESQVDCALACAAAAIQRPISPIWETNAAFAPSFFRYQDLLAVPLPAVHLTLARVAADGNPGAAVRRMPFQALPASARLSPIFLRFLVGVAIADGDPDPAPEARRRLPDLGDVVRVMLSCRLHVPVKVTIGLGSSLYRAAHDGLRTYQAARLCRIVAGSDDGHELSATLDLHDAEARRSARLALLREQEIVAACTVQMPLDEGPAETRARIAKLLLDRGVTGVSSKISGGACDSSCAATLALPL